MIQRACHLDTVGCCQFIMGILCLYQKAVIEEGPFQFIVVSMRKMEGFNNAGIFLNLKYDFSPCLSRSNFASKPNNNGVGSKNTFRRHRQLVSSCHQIRERLYVFWRVVTSDVFCHLIWNLSVQRTWDVPNYFFFFDQLMNLTTNLSITLNMIFFFYQINITINETIRNIKIGRHLV